MRADNSLESANRRMALHTITSLPLDPDFALFQHYPAMKIGVRESIRFYARLLVPLVEKIVASQPETTDWVMTSPPLYVIPSAANLLAWEISRIFCEMTGRSCPRVIDLRYTRPNPGSQDFTNQGDYSRSGVAERIMNRQRLFEGEWAPKPDPDDFHGRAVIVINDINVTGTQQEFIRRALETLGPASMHWLCVIDVDPTLGRLHPELEHSLNYLSLESFEDFAEVFAGADIDYTSRCINRLFRFPEAALEPLLRTLDDARRKRLHQLVLHEGAYAGEEYRKKLELIS